MDELKWELLRSYLEAEGIEVELFQEAIGHHIYPVMVDGLGRVQIFVSKTQIKHARDLMAEYEAHR